MVPVGFSLATVGCWGASDFTGGYVSRSANAFLVTAIGHCSGLIFVSTLALADHSPLPANPSIAWALAAGVCGGLSLALFYRALASGRMGLIAPLSAVLGAGLATIFTIFTEGLPHAVQLAGFVLAGLGIWLISSPEHDQRPEGLGLAVLAGMGFAGFFLCIKQAGNGSPFWIAAFSRASSLILTSAIVIYGRIRQRTSLEIDTRRIGLAALAGCLDVSGSVFFIRASQLGRLDEAVVLTSLYPVGTVLLARLFLREHLTRWKTAGMVAALLAVPLISWQ